MDSKTFARIINKGIKNSPETMEFLRAQAIEMLDECRISWENSCPNEDLTDLDARWDYYHVASKKWDEYFFKWIMDTFNQLPHFNPQRKLPDSIAYMFYDIIEEVLENFGSYELEIHPFMECVIEDDWEMRKENAEKPIA